MKDVFLIALLTSMFSAFAGAAPLDVTNTQGKSIKIDLLAVSDQQVTFKVIGKPQEFTLSLEQFDAASQDKIQEAAKTLKPRFPKIEIDVVVSKRRKKRKDSYYMVDQTVGGKVLIKNTSAEISMPVSKVKIMFLGRGRRTGDVYSVLATESFEASAEPKRTFERDLKKFVTSYDSDNRGYGNVGGYQYDSYVLGLFGEDDEVLGFKTSDPSIRSLVDKHIVTPNKILGFSKGMLLTNEMTVAPERAR